MDDLRGKEENKLKKKRRFKLRAILFWKKRKWWILSLILVAIIIIFPSQCGTAIGQWINDFIGNIIKNSGF